MFDFFLIYPVAFLIGLALSLLLPWNVRRSLLISVVVGAIPGAIAPLTYLPEAAEVPGEFGLFVLLAAFWTGIFSFVGCGIGLANRALLRSFR